SELSAEAAGVSVSTSAALSAPVTSGRVRPLVRLGPCAPNLTCYRSDRTRSLLTGGPTASDRGRIPTVTAVATVVRVSDSSDPRLGDFVGLTDVALRRRKEPAEGLFLAEGEKVIRRA